MFQIQTFINGAMQTQLYPVWHNALKMLLAYCDPARMAPHSCAAAKNFQALLRLS